MSYFSLTTLSQGDSLSSFCNLRSLELSELNLCPSEQNGQNPTWSLLELRHLQRLQLDSGTVCRGPEFPPSLQEWIVGPHVEPCESHLIPDESDLPLLWNVGVSRYNRGGPKWEFVGAALYRASKGNEIGTVRRLACRVDRDWEFRWFCEILSLKPNRLKSLTWLHLECQYLDDDTFARLVDACGALEYIKLVTARITGLSLRLLFDKSAGRLERVHLQNCGSVAFDAIDWLRTHDVVVEVENHQCRTDGRRIREWW